MKKDAILRIIDANLNRTREGLRVCEDIARFFLQDKKASNALKAVRHRATNLVLGAEKISLDEILSGRDTGGDKSKFSDFAPPPDMDIADIFMSNIERVKESLRVMEECFKVIDERISRGYRKLRFDTYGIEKKIVKKARLVSRNG
ncbi:MAG: thiamine-phosphate pyrophosphorylase [Candidatus Omnitrophota bacterium]|jgi:thiamine-phosphate pyrophosphorylase